MRDVPTKTERSTADDRTIGDALTRALEAAGSYVAVELRDGTISLSGEISSRQEREAVLDIAEAVAGARGLTIDDGLELIPSFPDSAFGDFENADHGVFGYLSADRDHDQQLDPGLEDEPDFAGDIGTSDPEEATAEAIPYFPSTDPVVRPTDDGQRLSVAGGFGATSLDSDQTETLWERRRPDDVVEQDVLRELRNDALTTDLQVEVEVRHGVVCLRGNVPTLDDAENAESVASRIGGVTEVREELAIASLR
ncbi:MAG TPA: BON domain-containing protein [Thermomicrobiales bacterium]